MSVDAGDEAVGAGAVLGVLPAEGLLQDGLFYVDAVEQCGGAWDEDDGKTEPIGGVEAES